MTQPQPETIPLSMLNAFEYCPRRFYYEFVMGDMLVNEFVLEGTLQHQRVDAGERQTSHMGDVQITRVYLASDTLRLSGFADLIEEHAGQFMPVEYKHGKEGKWLNDHVQLCAQALCLEERLPEQAPIPAGAIFYFGSRRRVQVPFTAALRAKTMETIAQAFAVAVAPTPPPPLTEKKAARCRDCSLRSLCLPQEVLMLNTRKGSAHANVVSD